MQSERGEIANISLEINSRKELLKLEGRPSKRESSCKPPGIKSGLKIRGEGFYQPEQQGQKQHLVRQRGRKPSCF